MNLNANRINIIITEINSEYFVESKCFIIEDKSVKILSGNYTGPLNDYITSIKEEGKELDTLELNEEDSIQFIEKYNSNKLFLN